MLGLNTNQWHKRFALRIALSFRDTNFQTDRQRKPSPLDVLYKLWPVPSKARQRQRPAQRPPAINDAAATTFRAERTTAKARRTLSHHHPKPTPWTHSPPPLNGPEQRQGQPAAFPPPYQPALSAHVKQMSCYRRLHGPQPNPQTESVFIYPRVPLRATRPLPAHPHGAGLRGLPRPVAAASPHDSTARTHAHTHAHAKGHGPARGWAALDPYTAVGAAELGPGGAIPWGSSGPAGSRQRTVDSSRRGGWMPQDAWKAMLANALHPQGVHPREIPAAQDHPYVLRGLQDRLHATRRERRRLWDIIPRPTAPTDTPSPPCKCRR